MKIPDFNTKKELFDFLIENKETLLASKKAVIKYADGVAYGGGVTGSTNKAISEDVTELSVKAAINTTNILDSHGDVHIKGIWNKSLKENKNIMHIQEHQMEFAKIISDGKDLKAKAVMMSFKELGYMLEGDTQVLLFESIVKADRNIYMFKQYKDGYVTNHSVGMRYVKLFLAINDEDYKEEFSIWNKYYSTIANKDIADSQGYFWAVTEAKVIEGSAVPIGSNAVTPTINIEPVKTTPTEPSNDTRKNIIINQLFKN